MQNCSTESESYKTFLAILRNQLTRKKTSILYENLQEICTFKRELIDRFIIELIKEDFVNPIIRVYCPNCDGLVSELQKLPDDDFSENCPNCGLQLKGEENTHPSIILQFNQENITKIPFFRGLSDH